MNQDTPPETVNVLKFVKDYPTMKSLDELSEIVFNVRRQVTAYLKTPAPEIDRHVFAKEIRKLAHEIENWADDFEMRAKP